VTKPYKAGKVKVL